jgi:hypothetical protein
MLIQFLPHREDTCFALQSISVWAFIKTINAYSETHEGKVSQYLSQVFGRPVHDQQYCYHHAPKVKPEAATAVVELLMMGVGTSETC